MTRYVCPTTTIDRVKQAESVRAQLMLNELAAEQSSEQERFQREQVQPHTRNNPIASH